MSNVIRLPRPHSQRPSPEKLGFFVHVGRNDHVELLHLIGTGERGIFGFVIGAPNIGRHRELITEARRHDIDVILDPKTQQMSFPGSHSTSLAALPWGSERHHYVTDFDGSLGRQHAEQIVDTAVRNNFTQLLGPTHVVTSPDDPWFRRDINMMNWTAAAIGRSGVELDLIYPLSLPMTLLRNANDRRALVTALADAPCDSIWLKIENFGDDATGEKLGAYIMACQDFHELEVPIVGDHIGGLPGLGALAFGAVGGMAHGVTMQQNFKTSNWRQPRHKQGGGPSRRVYIQQLDLFLKPNLAKELLEASPKINAMFGCRDSHCCPHGARDMINHAGRHAIYQRAREIERLSRVPHSGRDVFYLDKSVRPASDDVARIAAFSIPNADLTKRLQTKQRSISNFRKFMAHFADSGYSKSIAISPPQRQEKKVGKGRSNILLMCGRETRP